MNYNNTLLIIVSSLLMMGAAYLIAMVANRKSAHNEEDWAIGGRDLPIYVIIGTQFASCFGGGIMVAQVGNAYAGGFSVLIYGFYIAIVFFLFMIPAKWLRRNNFTTIPDILTHFSRRTSKRVVTLAAIMALVTPFGWICSQLTSFAKMYTTITGIPVTYLVIAVSFLSLFLVMPSGMKTVAWTDFVFSCFILVMCLVVLFWTVSEAGGMSDVMAAVPQENVTFPDFINKMGWSTMILWLFSIFPGNLTNQLYIQRVCAIDSVHGVNKSLAITGVLSFLSYAWACVIGLCVSSMNPALEESEMATGWLLTQMPLPLMAVFAGLLVAAIMSTISSAVQSVVVNITRDLYMVAVPNSTATRRLTLSKVFTVVVMAVSCLLSTQFTNVLGWFTYSYTFSAAALLFPIFLSYFLRKKKIITEQGIFHGMLWGVIACIVAYASGTAIPAVVFGLATSLVALLGVSYATRKPEEMAELPDNVDVAA